MSTFVSYAATTIHSPESPSPFGFFAYPSSCPPLPPSGTGSSSEVLPTCPRTSPRPPPSAPPRDGTSSTSHSLSVATWPIPSAFSTSKIFFSHSFAASSTSPVSGLRSAAFIAYVAPTPHPHLRVLLALSLTLALLRVLVLVDRQLRLSLTLSAILYHSGHERGICANVDLTALAHRTCHSRGRKRASQTPLLRTATSPPHQLPSRTHSTPLRISSGTTRPMSEPTHTGTD